MSSAPKDTESEQSPFYKEVVAAYGMSSHATVVKPPHSDTEYFTDYEPLKLSTFRVFLLSHGTVVHHPVLFVEQILVTCIYFACALPVFFLFNADALAPPDVLDKSKLPQPEAKAVSVRSFLSEQETKMRAFAMIMTGLAAFLLTFYTSVTVGRWWTMRTAGVGTIKAATVDLCLLLQQCVTTEQQVLSAVQRYGRASLMLIFLWRRAELGDLKTIMTKRELLTENECDKLLTCQHCLHETIWAWQLAIVTKLHMEGKIKSDKLFGMLIDTCTKGRAAVQCIHTHLAVKVPMMYVHLLGLLVKMHNLVLAIIMGLLSGAAFRSGYYILCLQLFGRTLILPFLFNAILIINCDLSDPFNGGEADFPGEVYQANLGKDCVGIAKMGGNVPQWLQSFDAA